MSFNNFHVNINWPENISQSRLSTLNVNWQIWDKVSTILYRKFCKLHFLSSTSTTMMFRRCLFFAYYKNRLVIGSCVSLSHVCNINTQHSSWSGRLSDSVCPDRKVQGLELQLRQNTWVCTDILHWRIVVRTWPGTMMEDETQQCVVVPGGCSR